MRRSLRSTDCKECDNGAAIRGARQAAQAAMSRPPVATALPAFEDFDVVADVIPSPAPVRARNARKVHPPPTVPSLATACLVPKGHCIVQMSRESLEAKSAQAVNFDRQYTWTI